MINLKAVLNKIIQGDINILIRQIPNNSIDLIITDPPYLLQSGGGEFKEKRKYLQEISDKQQFAGGITDEFLAECRRVMKKFNAYFFCNKHQLRQYINFAHDNNYQFTLLCYHKTNPSPLCNGVYLPDTEYVVFIKEKGVKLGGTYHTKKTYWVEPVTKNKFNHPTSKPVHLMERMLTNSSAEGDVVLDSFMGTGSTAVACVGMNRNFIGFELEEKYIDICCERLGDEVRTNYIVDVPTEVADTNPVSGKCPECGGIIKAGYCEDCLIFYGNKL